MTPLLGYCPDADTTTPGVITDCANFIPYQNGMESGPSAFTPGNTPALPAECLGAAVVTDLAGNRRVIAGTTTKLWELTGGAWIDRAGSAYAASADNRWSITQFGNDTLASNKANPIQRSVSGAFASIASAPTADIIFPVGAFVMALNINDGADKPDAWACCASFDATSWTPSTATQAATGRLVASPGALTAGARLGEYAVAYKRTSMYLGRYVGQPSIWDWTPVSGGEVGCVGKDALVDVNGVHMFVGPDNIWRFDGTTPVSIADGPLIDGGRRLGAVRQWFNDNCNPAFRYRCQCVFDRPTNRVWVFFPSNGSQTCDSALVYHVVTGQWGRSDRSIQAALSYVAPGITYDTWDSAGVSYDALPSVSYDSQFWLSGAQALSAFNTSNQLQLLNGASGISSFTTGDAGDDYAVMQINTIRLRYAPGFSPATASVQMFSKMNAGDQLTAGAAGSISDGKFDVIKAARWHRAAFAFTGNTRVTGIDAVLKKAGRR